jgi:transaldolase
MISKSSPSLLEQLEAAGVKVDVDSMDPKIAAGLPFTPHDMTSNQLLVNEQLQNPENKELVEKTIREMKGASWEDIHTVLVSQSGLPDPESFWGTLGARMSLTSSQTARFAKRVFPHIQGRVLAQTSPRNAYDKDKIVAHAHAYAKAYNAEGISK